MNDNPIYLQLTQRSRQLSNRTERLLPVSIGIVGVSAAAGAVYYTEVSGGAFAALALILVLGIVGVGFTVIAPSLAFLAAMSLAAKGAQRESLTLLSLTDITPRQIVDGTIGAVTDRLHILPLIGIGLVPPTIVILSYSLNQLLNFGRCPTVSGCGGGAIFLSLLLGCIVAVPVVGTLAGITILLFRLAVAAGVWVGFRWPGNALAGAGTLITLWIVLILLGLMNTQGATVLDAFCGSIAVVVLMTAIFAPLLSLFTRFAQSGAYRAIERTRQMQ